MIIRSLEDVSGTERDVAGEGWRSRRILRRDDGMNFSLHWTEVAAGTEMELTYAHHLEANLCIEGKGEVVDLATFGRGRVSTPFRNQGMRSFMAGSRE